ncbi:MAG: alpha/beta fold hydrolase [Anaerolineae bacterium]|nr:alpha/beta fold hydrolase [Anaerolineae bacterium]
MQTIPSKPGRWIILAVALVTLLSMTLFGATPPATFAQTTALQLTPTPTPTPAPGSAPPDPSGELAAEIQRLTAIVESLQAEIENLKSEIQNLKSQISNPPALPPNPTLKTLVELGGQPCPNSKFTCVTLTVPADHFDPANRQTLDVVFGVLPATGERKGMFVIATGGPGAAGLASADAYTSAFDPSILEHFDLVFFDQRGAGQSGGLQCPAAAAAFFETEIETKTPQGEAAAASAAQEFSEACLAELGSTDLLPYLGTRQAVEDLELFRQAMGDDKFWLYGESYGTQFAQTYAAAHPQQLAGLILDGTVDLTLTGFEYYEEWAWAFNDVLVMTLEACNADEECAADMGQGALKVYDGLAAQLAKSPRPFTFPLPSGGAAEREFSLADLEVAASDYLYSEASRLLLQRALAAAASHDDLVPLARLLYDSLSLDPETLEAIPDPTYSDAVYYGVECLDYAVPGNTSAERAETYLRAGDPTDAAVPRLSSIFYGDLPCAFWPTALEAGPRPTPLAAENIPTLVLGATADPATPVENSRRVYSRLAHGYLITTEGGAHVTFGRGNACPDDLVTAFLVDGKMPEQRETTCEGVVAEAYVPLPPLDAGAFADPLEALLSADTEINYLPEYYYWDTETPTSVGCPRGGTLAFSAGDTGDTFKLTNCAFSAGFAMTGAGLYSYDLGSFTLDVAVTGPAGVTGNLLYERNENGAIKVTGDYAGELVDLSEE